MQKQKASKRRSGYVYNDASPNVLVSPEPEAPADTVRQMGTVKAQLIGKLGSRGFGRLLAGMREEVEVEEAA